MPPLSPTRWCPTPEQRIILKELYSRGITNPNSSQIQKITAHLSFYGRIHSKNVFYWFQNHKARDRKKLKKMLAVAKQLNQQKRPYNHCHGFAETNYGAVVLDGMMKHDWSTGEDLPRDCYDLMMIPTFPCCGNRTLETLQLFPLTSPGQMDHQHEITASNL